MAEAERPPQRAELFCKDCRYWYGADPDEPRSAGFVLSAPYRPQEGPW